MCCDNLNVIYHLFMDLERGEESPTRDLKQFPDLTFAVVESFAKESSGCNSTSKAYKFFAEEFQRPVPSTALQSKTLSLMLSFLE